MQIEEIATLQRACRSAYDDVIEVETRDAGWRQEDASRADRRYSEAKKAYSEATGGLECELEEPEQYHRFRFPLREPSLERIETLKAQGVIA